MTDTKQDHRETPAAVPTKSGAKGTALSVVGFVAALGLGFFFGKWITKPDAPDMEVAQGDRYRVELRGDEPQKGPDNALVTVVEFADFECPYCAKGSASLMDAAEDFGDDVRVVFKHYPLPLHRRAIPAARAAWAAHRSGKFWELHDWLYEGRGDLSDVTGEVTALGLDPQAFSRDMLGDEAAKAIDEDTIAGGKIGVTGTPAYVVNGHPYSGAMSADQWEQILEAELATAEQLVESGVERGQVYAELMQAAKLTRGDGNPVGGKPSARQPARRPGEPAPDVAYRVTAADRPSIGPADALVTIVEFSDFQCPFCKRLAPVNHQIVKDNPDVRVVFRQMPLPNHPQARGAAKASLAAHRQGKFWEMHDRIFRGVGLTEPTFVKWAGELGLDVETFKQALSDPALDEIIDEDVALARQFGVMATPTAFVNGRYVRGAQTARSLQVVVDEEREKAQKLVAQGVPPDQVFAKLMESAATAVTDDPPTG